MPERMKKSWPKTPQGTIDWEALFEDKKTGFVPTIAKAETRDALILNATRIIQSLFNSPDDVDQLQAFAAHLKDAVNKDPHGHDLDHLQTTVISLLRDIKETHKAEDQAQADAKEKEAEDTSKKTNPRPTGNPPTSGKKRKKTAKKKYGNGKRIPAIVPKALLALLGLAGGGLILYQVYSNFGTNTGSPEEQAAAVQFVQHYIQENRPSDQWEIIAASFNEDRKVAIEILVKDKRHLGIIASQSTMARQAFIHSLCPPQKGDILPYLEKGWGVWITLTDGRTKLTAGTCPYIGLRTK